LIRRHGLLYEVNAVHLYALLSTSQQYYLFNYYLANACGQSSVALSVKYAIILCVLVLNFRMQQFRLPDLVFRGGLFSDAVICHCTLASDPLGKQLNKQKRWI
jgi:putative copper export protein